MQTRGMARAKTENKSVEETSENESLRAAYMAVAGKSGRVVSGAAMKLALQNMIDTEAASTQTTAKISNLLPIDAAIEAIAQAEHQQSIALHQQIVADTYPVFVESPKPENMAAALRAQYAPPPQPENTPKETAVTQNAPARPMNVERFQTENQCPIATESVVASKPAFAVGKLERKPSVPGPEIFPRSNEVARPVKLPKFLMESEPEKQTQKSFSELAKPVQLAAKSGKMSAFADEIASLSQPAHPKLPPVSQALFSDLGKPAKTETSRKSFQPENAVSTASSRTISPRLETAADTLAILDISPMDEQATGATKYHNYDSVWVKLFERPRMLLGVLGLGIVSCSVYLVLGYCWFGGSPVSQAAEPVTMLNLNDPSNTDSNNPTSTFNNIRTLQQNSNTGEKKSVPANANQAGMLLAQAGPAVDFTGASSTPGHEPVKSEPTGRADPFAPLVSGASIPDASKTEGVKKDIFADVQYTGFIGDINSRDKVALIKVNDATTGTTKTLIKKAGETMLVGTERIMIKGISKHVLSVSGAGESRQLPIQQYQTTMKAPVQPGASAAGTSGAAGSTSPTGGSGADPTHPALSEPNG